MLELWSNLQEDHHADKGTRVDRVLGRIMRKPGSGGRAQGDEAPAKEVAHSLVAGLF